MGNISIQRVCGDTLVNYITAAIPALAGKAATGAAGPDTTAPCLSLRVMPQKFTFEAADPAEVYEAAVDDGKVIVDVGQFTGMFTIELRGTTKLEREEYEQRILDLFLSSAWAPGTLYLLTPTLIVNGYTSLYQADFKIFLQDSEWNEDYTFEAKRGSFIDVYVDFPALTTYNAVNLVSLQVCLAATGANIVTVADINVNDRVEVLLDGTTTKGTI